MSCVLRCLKCALNCLRKWANLLMVLAATVACWQTWSSARSTSELVESLASTWKTTQHPLIHVKRVGRSDDGKQFNHEDCAVQNEGVAPKSYTCLEVKTYLRFAVFGCRRNGGFREVYVPVRFYSYGVVPNAYVGVVYQAVGDNARKRDFDFGNAFREFAEKHGATGSVDLIVVAHVGYIDMFGERHEEFFKVPPVSHQRIIDENEYKSYDQKAAAFVVNTFSLIDYLKLDLDMIWSAWIDIEVPKKMNTKGEFLD